MGVQTERDDASGLHVSDRYFEPEGDPGRHGIFWNATDICILYVIVSGLFMLVTTGLDIDAGVISYFLLLIGCSAFILVLRSRWHRKHRLICCVCSLIVWLAAIWIVQDRFVHGAKELVLCMSAVVNRTYSGTGGGYSAAGISADKDIHIFILLVFIPVIYILALAMTTVRQMLMVYMIVLPVVLVLALCGACDSTIGLFLVLTGVLLCMVHTGTLRQTRMWGGTRKKLRTKNTVRYENIQKTGILISLMVCVVLFIPGYSLVRPILSFSLKPLETVSIRVQSSFLSQAVKILPDISAGKWNLQVESVGGGVDEGSLKGTKGYQIDNMEDLKVTIDKKPEENIFLRGFVGTIYGQGSWTGGYGTTFDAAALNWNTDGSPRLYIQNLTFLRTSYALEQAGSSDPGISGSMSGISAEAASMQVERINANDRYTYVPYGVYLNDYYSVASGDGYVESQNEQADRYPFYFRKDIDRVLGAWNLADGTDSVMDRVEESYRAYCVTNCLDVSGFPGGMVSYDSTYGDPDHSDSAYSEYGTETPDGPASSAEELAQLIRTSASEGRWKGQQNIDDITAWIRKYLNENYEYSKENADAPDGTDELEYFLFDSRKGNSVNFASAAVMMYRMYGIPARYVVGYELTYSMFTAQPDGTYTAAAQGENSQAWAEIYKDGIGWVPEDLTPGVMGTYDEVGPGGELIEQNTATADEPSNDEQSRTDEKDGSDNTSYNRNYTVGQLIGYLLFIVSSIFVLTFFVLFIRKICLDLGYTFAGRRTCKQRLIGEFQAFYKKMLRFGLSDEIDSQDEKFALFCENYFMACRPDVASMVRPCIDRLYDICYGGDTATEKDVVDMRKLVAAVYVHSRKAGKDISVRLKS